MFLIFLSNLNKILPLLFFFLSSILFAATAFEKSDFKNLDFLESTQTLISGHKIFTLKDLRSGHILRSFYSPFGEVELLEESTLSGKLIERRNFKIQGADLLIESFEPRHRILTFRTLSTEIQQVEVIEDSIQGLSRWTYRLPLNQALNRCEPSSMTPDSADRILADLSWLHLEAFTKNADSKKTVELGNQLVAENCAQFPNGGIDRLAQASTEGIRRGVLCLSKLGPSGKMTAAKLVSFFEPQAAKKAKIICGHSGESIGQKKNQLVIQKNFSAHAFDHNSPDFPGLYLNLDDESFAKKPEFAPGVIFHEMIHWLGYTHGSELDMSYLAESCCFTDPKTTSEQSAQTEACQLLKDNPAFTSEDYHRRFAKVMKSSGLPSIPLQAAWLASQSPQRDASPLMASVLSSAQEDLNYWGKQAREKGDLLSHLILGNAALENIPKKIRAARKMEFQKKIGSLYSTQEVQSQMSDYLGTAMNAILNRNEKQFVTAWKNFRQIRKEVCSILTRQEKKQIQKTLNLVGVEFFDVKPSIASYHSEIKQPCP